jgi:hypothetical protein
MYQIFVRGHPERFYLEVEDRVKEIAAKITRWNIVAMRVSYTMPAGSRG